MMSQKATLKNVAGVILYSTILAIVSHITKVNSARLITSDAVIASPNPYPNNYINYQLFEASPEYRIKLVFSSIDVEMCRGINCTCDNVTIYDGEHISSHVLGTFCGDKIPLPVATTANKMLIVMKTDYSVTKGGYVATLTREINIKAIVTRKTELSLIQQLLNKRRQQTLSTNKWGKDISRTAVALFLNDPQFFAAGNETGEEIAYELNLQLMSKLVMKKQITTTNLALYSNALTVACIDPKNFFSVNIIAELRKRVDQSNHTNPFLMLALCIGGDTMNADDIYKLQQLYESHSRRSWTGIQAMVIMALICISKQSHVLNLSLQNKVSEIKKKQQENGTVENLKTAALVIQALLATESQETNFNLSMAVKSILSDMKHTHLSIEEIYYILPIINHKSLLDINLIHCANKTTRTELEEMVKLSVPPINRIRVQMSIIIGDDMDFSLTWTFHIKPPSNLSLYHVLENMNATEPDYKIQFINIEGKPYIYRIANFEESIENGLSWFIYCKPLSSLHDLVLVEKSPVDIKLDETDTITLWFRSESLPNSQKLSSDSTVENIARAAIIANKAGFYTEGSGSSAEENSPDTNAPSTIANYPDLAHVEHEEND